MRQTLTLLLGAMLLVLGWSHAPLPQVLADSPKPAAPAPKIKVGDMAPDFSLTDQYGKKVSLKDYRGKKSVVLAFYVFAFTSG